tara:strand:- start:16022 stop:17014 length:993 start_codon:yes stop_codon:yes gene_type:complete
VNILIYGAGAIGCHIGYCLYQSGHNVTLLTRGKHYENIKKNGMHIKICDNEKLIESKTIKENSKINYVSNSSQIQKNIFDYLFITVKLNDYNEKTFLDIQPFLNENTAIIPPCTKIPFWWLYNLEEKSLKKFNNLEIDVQSSKFFKKENIIGMTMWLSSVIESPGNVVVKHVQRGYPLKEVFSKMKNKADKLRESIQPHCLSPEVDNIKSELYIKTINSLAFNLVALDTEFNNSKLKNDANSIKAIKKIMEEGEQIAKKINLPIFQSINDRVSQTLSSTAHTMSMLNDFKIGRRPELDHLWKSFKTLSKIFDLDMDFTESLYQKVKKKIY